MTSAQYQRGFVAKRSAERNESRAVRMRAGRPSRQDIAVMLAAYKHNTPRPPIILPKITIQQDAE